MITFYPGTRLKLRCAWGEYKKQKRASMAGSSPSPSSSTTGLATECPMRTPASRTRVPDTHRRSWRAATMRAAWLVARHATAMGFIAQGMDKLSCTTSTSMPLCISRCGAVQLVNAVRCGCNVRRELDVRACGSTLPPVDIGHDVADHIRRKVRAPLLPTTFLLSFH